MNGRKRVFNVDLWLVINIFEDMDVGISFLVYSRLQLYVFDLEAISNSASLTREIIYTTYFNQSISWSEHEWCDFYFPPRISALISAQYCIPIVGLIYWCIAFKVEQMRCNVWPFDVRGEGNCEKIVWSGHKKSKMSSLHRTHTSKTLTFYTNRDLQLFLPSYPKRCWWRNFHFFKINSSKWTSYKCQG